MLYFIRTGVSIAWVITVSALSNSLGSGRSPNALIELLLVLYPITDAMATIVDIRSTPPESQTRFQRLNLIASLITAAVLVVIANGASMQSLTPSASGRS